MLLLRAFSALLSYPSEEMRRALPEIVTIIKVAPIVQPRERSDLLELIDELGRGDVLGAEEHYVDLFDRGRALSLHLFEHLHGESRDRGEAMVELAEAATGSVTRIVRPPPGVSSAATDPPLADRKPLATARPSPTPVPPPRSPSRGRRRPRRCVCLSEMPRPMRGRVP